MSAKRNQHWVALCSVAIGMIYAAGYAVTRPEVSAQAASSNNPLAPQTHSAAANAVAKNSTLHQTKPSTSSKPSGFTSAPQTAKSSTTAQQKYKDGTFHGYGTNAFGTVAVQLTIVHGKITSVQITQCSTHYPQSFIDPVLPNEVLSLQSYQIDAVSGATESSMDFAMAVYQALQAATVA